jgi:hypothetical protein
MSFGLVKEVTLGLTCGACEIGGICSTRGKDENTCKILSENMKERDRLKDGVVDGRILEKCGVRMWMDS